ncbi:MAG TPA: DUF2946 family protein [Stellaceae bacterium]|nr:DUF2946 family protein [Stellaceae bacterium]
MRKARTVGAWLSLLALYVQVMLPLLVAVEIWRVDAAGLGAAGPAVCRAGTLSRAADHGRAAGAPRTGHDHSQGCCPLCSAVGTPFIAPAEIFVPASAAWNAILPLAAGVLPVAYSAPLTYEARAPPLNG